MTNVKSKEVLYTSDREENEKLNKFIERVMKTPVLMEYGVSYFESHPNASYEDIRSDKKMHRLLEKADGDLNVLREGYGLPRIQPAIQPERPKSSELENTVDSQASTATQVVKKRRRNAKYSGRKNNGPFSNPSMLDDIHFRDCPDMKVVSSLEPEKSYDHVPIQVLDEVRKILAEQLNAKLEDLNPTTRLIQDLGADDLDFAELYFELEERFGKDIYEEHNEHFNGPDVFLGDIADYFRDCKILEKTGAKQHYIPVTNQSKAQVKRIVKDISEEDEELDPQTDPISA